MAADDPNQPQPAGPPGAGGVPTISILGRHPGPGRGAVAVRLLRRARQATAEPAVTLA